MRISVVTPSYRASAWLKLCIASVADQAVECEHIVQDAGSDDGTAEWLRVDPRVKAFVERDSGMYDAVNRGFRRASGEIFAYLNCDEQYIEGSLSRVIDFFQGQPQVQVAFGDVVMVDKEGNYLYHRRMQTPLRFHTWTCHLSTLSCAMFFRREVFERYTFDPAMRDAGDGEWMVRLLKTRMKMAALGFFTSTFTLTGANMSGQGNARRENRDLRRSAPLWARAFRPAFIAHHRLRRWAGGMYTKRPFAYSIYTHKSPKCRQVFHVENPIPRDPR